jgi:hypothetical protein
MTPVIEAFLIASLAGMLAGVTVGCINRKLEKMKKYRKKWSKWPRGKKHEAS